MMQDGAFKEPSELNKDATISSVSLQLTKAYNLGVQHASKKVSVKPKEAAKGIAKDAPEIVIVFIVSVKAWLEQHKNDDDDDKQSAFDAFIDNLCEVTALWWIMSLMQQGVIDAFSDAGVEKVMWVCNPDACDMCLENADAGAIGIDEAFPSGHDRPPGHSRCRCIVTRADEDN